MSRRNFTLGGLAASTGFIGYVGLNDPSAKEEEALPAPAADESPVRLEMTGERPAIKRTNFAEVYLKDKRCTGLASQYFDLASDAIFPEQIDANYLESMRDMWQRKVEFSRKREMAGKEKPGTTREVRELGDKVLAQYESLWQQNAEHEGIHTFRDLVLRMDEIRTRVLTQSLDWDKFAEYYRIPNTEEDHWLLDKIKYFAGRVNPRSLAAYSMTEIMPTGPLALREYEAIIRNAGMAFANRIPAMGDARDSFGAFQLTEIAIDQGVNRPRTFRTQEGEKVTLSLNDMLEPRDRTPQQIRDFTTTEHHTTGALLFAVHNLVVAIKGVEHDDDRIDRITHMDGATFASVLAAHHYRPKLANQALLKWTKDRNWTNQNDPVRTYYEFCTDEDREAKDPNLLVGQYAGNSFDNFRRVQAYFEELGS